MLDDFLTRIDALEKENAGLRAEHCGERETWLMHTWNLNRRIDALEKENAGLHDRPKGNPQLTGLAGWVDAVVKIEAVDWLLYTDARPRTEQFEPMNITLYGLVVAADDDALTIAPQVYASDEVRCAQCIPVACIRRITRLMEPESR